jgi:putative tryptophan/tyrosine transport system substrate-binding protein
MRRRDFMYLLSSATVAAPLAVRAQQSDQVRRIGVLMNFAADDLEGQARVAAFTEALPKLGWTEGRNLRLEAADDPNRNRQYAEELVALSPDAIIASGSPSLAALRRVTRSVPIVFANVIDL